MPAQERVGSDQAKATHCSGQPPSERGEEGAAQDGDRVPQYEELDVHGGVGAAQQQDQPEHPAEDQIQQPQRHAAIMPNSRSPLAATQP